MQSILLLSNCRRFKTIIFFFLIFVFPCILFAQDSNNSSISLLKVGEKAPINVLKDTSNNEMVFPAANKWNLIFYWSLFCHSCIEEMPEIQEGLDKLEGKDFSTFFVSLDSEKMQKALINFKKRRKFSQTILMEKLENEKYVTADSWGVTMTPSVFIVNPEGKILFSHQGPLDLDLFFKNLPEQVVGSSETESTEKIEKIENTEENNNGAKNEQ